jgi:hypothetical protein
MMPGTTMKRTIIAITLAWSGAANAGEIPSRSDMLDALVVVGVYSKLCATPLSEAAKARVRTITRMLGDMDSASLERRITMYSASFTPDDIGPWCRETTDALREGSK